MQKPGQGPGTKIVDAFRRNSGPERRPKGTLQIQVIEKATGTVVQEHTFRNIVVNNAKTQMAHLLGGDTTNRFVNRMQFGTGTTAEAVADIALETPITPVKAAAAATETPDVYSVQFTAQLTTAEANGFPITEAGLLFGNNTLCARKVFGALNKTSDFVFQFTWTISWS